ncbi:DUF6600 domain-containing protein [Mucilaginibacter aquaedulcis]|uniref:DUF6600 domain-containing protein n=1 Tax=Mucilaginibacter aquaedulcis TaxID=1187081 RepID=UPI0025B3057D|nr:DUF6600 domain-containing protein [Mucilaginibacter aquaedulcis]MDN3551140.1 hypothetical protein [Mucilaginibacter aquaedulcis]
MKKICGLGLIAFLIMLAAPNKARAQEGDYVSDQEFYDELDPYGTWVNDPNYGDVWIPDAEDGFRPYATNGHWVVTDYGNTWVSDYPWGWATFHYGRWRYDDYYGWEWIPGHEWAPAWVSWRSGGGYYGWAPLSPGISINLSFGNSYHVPDYYWVCAPQAYINSPNIYNYYVPHTRVVNIINRTTIINNTYVYNKRTYVTGPRIAEIRRVTRQNVPVYRVGTGTRVNTRPSISNNQLNIYRPEIKRNPDARPARVVNAAEYRKENPNNGIAHRVGGQATVNRNNAARLAEVAKSENNKLVSINNHNRSARPAQPANQQPAQPNAGGGQRVNPSNRGQANQQLEIQRQQQNAQRQQQDAQRQQQQETQRQQQTQREQQQQAQRQQQGAQRQQEDAQRQQQQDGQRQQQNAQRQQQQEAQRQQQNAQRQQQNAQRQQQQEAQRQQQNAQRQQQQEAQRQQQNAQRQQQQEAQRQQQNAQRQQQQEAQRQQQNAQRQQQQEAQRQQQQAQRQQQEAQRQQQQAQRQQQEAQRQQQQQQQEQQGGGHRTRP